MIGNDVVDITASRIESNWKRKGFLVKIFSVEEQELITASANPELIVWVLWSMKEAAYKVFNRNTGIRSYIPHKLLCSKLNKTPTGFSGTVEYDNAKYFTITVVNNNIIHTVSVADLLDINKIMLYKKNTNYIKIKSLPFINIDNQIIPASVSHHGISHKIVYLNKW